MVSCIIMYTLTDFYHLHKKNNYKLPQSVITTINDLCTSIGIDTIFEFKQTITQTKQDVIRELNKITEESSFDTFLTIINHENMESFAEDIFTILTSNKYLMKKNVELFVLLDYPSMKTQFHQHTEAYLESFKHIRVGDQSDYETFCEINKENDVRKTYGIFLTEVDRRTQSTYGKDTCTMIMSLINECVGSASPISKDVLNEYIDNVAILSKYTVYDKEQIEHYTTLPSETVGSRFIFTCMDILQL
jgi:hypothetical protein